MEEVVPLGFYLGTARSTAPAVLGMLLCRRMPDGSVLRLRLTETEAYCGVDDTGAHAHKGRTARTEVLWHAGGRAYVYRCHMYWLLNLTVGPEDVPECILIRGVEGASGPGRVSIRMGFDRSLYGKELVPDNGLWLEDDGSRPESIIRSPRIGIPYADEKDRNALLNFRAA